MENDVIFERPVNESIGDYLKIDNSIIYEQPLNEIVRTCLRLEHVFHSAQHFLSKHNTWDYRAALRAITDIMAILDRPDFKGKIKQELIRYKSSLKTIQDHKEVNKVQLQTFINQIEENIEYIDSLHGKLADDLRENDFLTNIRHNLQKAGGTCDFDSPNYHYWLSNDALDQHAELKHWFSKLDKIEALITLMLQSIRDSTEFEKAEASCGSYQRTLETNQPYQLLRVAIDKKIAVFPEMSVGKQRFSICFRSPSTTQHTEQVKEDISFKIACCKL